MKMIARVLFFAAFTAFAASASVVTVGFEDWSGSGSDRDFNDTVFQVTGVNVRLVERWLPLPPRYPEETPFPFPASYFDSAVANGDPIVAAFLFQQTAATEIAYMKIGAGDWLPVTGTSSHFAVAGDPVYFRILVGDGFLYPAAGENADGTFHAVAAQHVPEPSALLMIGAGVCLMLLSRVRGKIRR